MYPYVCESLSLACFQLLNNAVRAIEIVRHALSLACFQLARRYYPRYAEWVTLSLACFQRKSASEDTRSGRLLVLLVFNPGRLMRAPGRTGLLVLLVFNQQARKGSRGVS